MNDEIAGLFVTINADLSGLMLGLETTQLMLAELSDEGGLLGSLPVQVPADIKKMVTGVGTALAPLPAILETGLKKPIAEAMEQVSKTLQQNVEQMIRRLYDAALQIHSVALKLGVPSPINVAALEGRAEGGTVLGGRAYLVGEAGPELFVPGITGQIVPNHALGGGGGSTVVIQNVTVQSYAQDADRLLDEVVAAAGRRGAERVFDL